MHEARLMGVDIWM